MPRRNLENRNIRKIFKSSSSYCVTLPVEMVKKLKWKEKQKLTVELKGKNIVFKDWKK